VKELRVRANEIPCHSAMACLGGPDLGVTRIAGPGLGNMLFPWARAVIWANQEGKPMIYPTWPQVKLGPWLRRERDKRAYFEDFVPREGEIVGLKKFREMIFSTWIDEDSNVIRSGLAPGRFLRAFRGLRDFFVPLLGHREIVRHSLMEATRIELRGDADDSGGIGIHVRCGDFIVAKGSEPTVPVGQHTRLSSEWYAHTLHDVLGVWPSPPRIRVFSDGSTEELGELMSIPGVERAPKKAAIGDIIDLSRCRVMIATPNSTFSMWAKFLGGCITVSLPAVSMASAGLTYEITEYGSDRRREALRCTLR